MTLPYESYIWSNVPDQVRRWAEDVKRDIDTPDLWAELRRDRAVFLGVRYEAVDNTPFTPSEQVEIANQLREIQENVKRTYSLSNEQMSLVVARFDEVEAAARRIGRKDWVLLFCGAMFSVIVTDLLPPAAVQHIFTMALSGLDHLFRSGGGPHQLPPLPLK